MWLCPAFLLAACGWAVAETWDARSSFSDFESENFNVTAALLAQGVNVSAIPPLATLQERSDESTCSNAVSGWCLFPGSKIEDLIVAGR